MAQLRSLNVGLPRDVEWRGRTVRTAVWKTPVPGRRMVRRLNIDGDGQGDLAGHGGENRAVYVYQLESYHYWQQWLGRGDFGHGQFGENFTIDGLADDQVCIGDRFRIGGAVLEVTQPRVTCYRLGLRMDEPQMPALLVAHGRPGFYCRVIEEGEVGAGDEIVQVAADPERLTVAAASALLYKPGHPRGELERALRIPSLSAGWRGSFQALLEQAEGGAPAGNPGLAPASGPPPAWPGFRSLRVSRKDRESSHVISLTLEPADGKPLAPALPGQFVVLRLQPAPGAPALLRSYSLSGAPSDSCYRVSIKREMHGAAGSFVESEVQVGDLLDASAPRGSFTLAGGEGPVVLLSAGIGVTPVLAMLHTLAAAASPREVWWVHGARDGGDHPFAEEARRLLAGLPRSHSHIRYSAPRPGDRPAVDFDAPGRLGVSVLQDLGVPRDADYHLCGPTAFLGDLTTGLRAWGVAAGRIHSELFGSGRSFTPGVAAAPRRLPHQPDGPEGAGPLVSFARSNINVRWSSGTGSLLDLAEACDIPVKWSCRTGVCHTCETGLVNGAVGYQPDPLEPPAEGNILICCCRPKGDIVIDL
ncbi:MOSC domain-containing protein [Inquilinus sp. YAF38]|uniref:MOSC domain-containing protein n=1 Tax=Inquilinus sp. YAF38 TaxID=3233084 RepID=UPI003F927932